MRPGHHRPLGTTQRRRFEWSGDRLPELGDVARQITAPDADDAHLVRRAYLVVGVEEGRSRDRFHLVLERVEYDTRPDAPGASQWFFLQHPAPLAPGVGTLPRQRRTT